MGMSICFGNVRHLRYSTFNHMRKLLADAAYPMRSNDPLWLLLRQCDVEGDIDQKDCSRLAKRINGLIPKIKAMEDKPKDWKRLLRLIVQLSAELEDCPKRNIRFGWN